jgi:4'-phosphopantetheinyl transferase EntD
MKIIEHRAGSTSIYALNIKDELIFNEESYAREWCSLDDFETYKAIVNSRKRREFLAVRFLLWRIGLSSAIFYDQRIPKLRCGQYVSISHSGDWVVVAVNPEHVVGVDVELIQDKASGVYHRFSHVKEKEYFPKEDFTASTLLWSFKETIYKLMWIEGLNFKEQIRVKKDAEDKFKAEILTEHIIFEVLLDYKIVGDYVLTFNLGDVQRQQQCV